MHIHNKCNKSIFDASVHLSLTFMINDPDTFYE